MKRFVLASVLSFLLGAFTSYAQGFLPDAIASFANSASGWTLLTALLVFWTRLPARPAAALGAVSFVLLVLGYTAASELRGFPYSPILFSVVGIVVGPFVGVATAWLRNERLRAALGTALLSGIGIGESVYGLTTVRETTHPAYWVLIGLVGVVLLIGMLVRRIRGAVPVVVATGGAMIIAVAFVLAYRALGVVPLL